MKKIVLSLGMLIAIATASYAQQNTSTLEQVNGARNEATMTQNGSGNGATIQQNGSSLGDVTDNKGLILQQGRNNAATIVEVGKSNDVQIRQTNGLNAAHAGRVEIIGGSSDDNDVIVTQTGKAMSNYVQLQGDGNSVTYKQSGDTNQGFLDATTGSSDANTVDVTQSGKDGQSYIRLQGDNNLFTIKQAGNTNNIGNYTGLGPAQSATFTRVRFGNSLTGANFLGANATPVGISVNSGINVTGDLNTIAVTQAADTRNNFVGVELAGSALDGANRNTVNINQLGMAEDNVALVYVTAGQDRNTATINQTGSAQFNKAGIYQRGSDDMATINQTGKTNVGVIEQMATTVTGTNMATINQYGSLNNAYIMQDGINASTATITQNFNGHVAEIYQTGNGGHIAEVTQNSGVTGTRLILEQTGTRNQAYLTQQDISNIPTDVEIRQTGKDNVVRGITGGGVIRYTQTGNGNGITATQL